MIDGQSEEMDRMIDGQQTKIEKTAKNNEKQ
jgi:hypothetical protein